MDNKRSDAISRVREWLSDNERSVAWLARKAGWTRVHLGNVLNGKVPMSHRMARDLSVITGLDLQGEKHGNTKAEERPEGQPSAAARMVGA